MGQIKQLLIECEEKIGPSFFDKTELNFIICCTEKMKREGYSSELERFISKILPNDNDCDYWVFLSKNNKCINKKYCRSKYIKMLQTLADEYVRIEKKADILVGVRIQH